MSSSLIMFNKIIRFYDIGKLDMYFGFLELDSGEEKKNEKNHSVFFSFFLICVLFRLSSHSNTRSTFVPTKEEVSFHAG